MYREAGTWMSATKETGVGTRRLPQRGSSSASAFVVMLEGASRVVSGPWVLELAGGMRSGLLNHAVRTDQGTDWGDRDRRESLAVCMFTTSTNRLGPLDWKVPRLWRLFRTFPHNQASFADTARRDPDRRR